MLGDAPAKRVAAIREQVCNRRKNPTFCRAGCSAWVRCDGKEDAAESRENADACWIRRCFMDSLLIAEIGGNRVVPRPVGHSGCFAYRASNVTLPQRPTAFHARAVRNFCFL